MDKVNNTLYLPRMQDFELYSIKQLPLERHCLLRTSG